MTELLGVEVVDCPTSAGAPCGCCDRCIALQVESLAAEALLGSPSDLDHP